MGTEDADRRAFLGECRRFASVTSPEVVVLLSTSLKSDAVTVSGGRGPEVTSVPARRSRKLEGVTSCTSWLLRSRSE